MKQKVYKILRPNTWIVWLKNIDQKLIFISISW
jgi:hypothetical protein